MIIKYVIYNPSGNITALVLGKDYDYNTKKIINNTIMEKHKNVEQVGFISLNTNELVMAGNEYCANATRCAAKYYLKDNIGKIHIKTSGFDGILETGIDEALNVWAQIPIYDNTHVDILDNGISIVKIYGITHIVLDINITNIKIDYMKENELKLLAKNIIQKYNVDDDAIGVIFTDFSSKYQIYPVVWVKSIDTLFFENSCGSGTASVAITQAQKNKETITIDVIQPSKEILKTTAIFKQNNITRVTIAGKVETDNVIRIIEINNCV